MNGISSILAKALPPPTRSKLVILVLVLFCVGMAAAEEPVVASVQVRANSPGRGEDVAEILEIQVGQPLDRARLRNLIMTFYAGGQVEWLRVESAETPDGLDVVVEINFRSTISDIKVRTKKPLLRARVHRWLQLEIGDPVIVADIETSRRRVERRLQDRGWAAAAVDAYLEFNRETNTVEVEIEVDAGDPQVVGSAQLSGLDDLAVIGDVMPKVKVGTRLTSRYEDRLRTGIEENLRNQGYWEAEVLAVDRRAQGADVELAFHVESGPRYRLDLEAPPETMKIAEKVFPDPAQGDLHPAQTDALAEEVQEQLQNLGYLLAEVEATLASDADGQVLRLQVQPGQKRKITAVEFPGGDSIHRGRLAETVTVKTGAVGGRFKQKVSNATLEADRKALQELYHREGFPYATVSPPQIVVAEGEGEVRVLFPIAEGQRWMVSEVRIEGLPVEAAAELEARPLGLADESPWSPGVVERAGNRIDEALADAGYPEGKVVNEVDTSQEGRARVTFRVEQGQFVRVGDVIIAGLLHTRESLVNGVVRRAGVVSGEPLSRKRMLEAQRGLYELGLFRRVEVVPMPGHERRMERNIVVRCEEGEQKSYLFGIGYSNVDAARLILGWSHLNLLGRAYGFSAEVSLSSRQQRYSLSLRKRRALGLPVPGYLAIYRTDEVLADRDLLRRGLWIDFGDRLKRPFRPWFRYEYEIIQSEIPFIDLPRAIVEEFQESKVASITPSIEWDTRDNPLAPVRGVFASASVQYAFPAFLADSHFLKVRTGATIYQPMLRGFVAAGLRLGAISPIGGNPELPSNLQIPFAYRFFAGGRTTHRAFTTDRLGIPGQTIIEGSPIGGNALILLNFEYRRRVTGELFAALFIDAGNVWASPSQVKAGEIRWGPGIGLQYRTPAGPLRAEYAWKFDPEPGEKSGQFFISFGVPF